MYRQTAFRSQIRHRDRVKLVVIREATPDDVGPYAKIQEEEWDDSMAAVDLKIESRIELFPEGVLVAEHDGDLVGVLSLIQLASYDVSDGKSWEDITDNGWCTTHTPGGDVLFGVDLSVSRKAPRATAPLLFMAGMELAMRLGCSRIVWGGRMPRYHKHADKMSPQEYATARTKRGRYLDPEIELYSKVPGASILGVVPEYFKDWESLNNGVMLEWPNPVRRFKPLKVFRKQIVGLLYRSSRRHKRV